MYARKIQFLKHNFAWNKHPEDDRGRSMDTIKSFLLVSVGCFITGEICTYTNKY